MFNTKDIYYKVNTSIINTNFWKADNEQKQSIIDEELKKYIITKLEELGIKLQVTSIQTFTIHELLELITNKISKEQQFDIISNFVHYILGVAGNLQGLSITWWQEDNTELIDFPLVEFNKQGLWDSLKTHKETDYLKIFDLVYSSLSNKILSNKKNNKIM